MQFIRTSSNLQWNCHHSIYAYETVFCSSDPPPASYSTPDRSGLNSDMAVQRSAHYLKGWKLLCMVASRWIWYHLMRETAVLIRCSAGFRFKSIAKDPGEIKRVAFQSPPDMSALTKVLQECLDRKGMEEQRHQALSRHEEAAFRGLSQLHRWILWQCCLDWSCPYTLLWTSENKPLYSATKKDE